MGATPAADSAPVDSSGLPPGTADFVTGLWAQLESIGRDAGSGGYRRFAWTATDHTLREWFAGTAEALGLSLTLDRVGNQWAWLGDPDAALAAGRQPVVIGSHLDSVPDGGAYDGPLGVVSALGVVDALRRTGIELDVPLAVVNFVDEEGARFGVACSGSRVLTGQLAADRALGLRDADGLSMADAWRAAGRDPRTLGRDEETLRRIGTFVELHVEQGRALVDLGEPIAVGTGIWPHGRWRFDLAGTANHAGTTRMQDRDDPMLRFATLVQTANSAALEHGCVATVGKVAITPGAVNAIPSRVQAWLDARGADPEAVHRVVEQVAAGVTVHPQQESWTDVTEFDPELGARLAATLGQVPLLGTGAGHDAGVLATAGIASAMLFVRNPTGVSHAPDEHAEWADCLRGVAALLTVVRDLATHSHPSGSGAATS